MMLASFGVRRSGTIEHGGSALVLFGSDHWYTFDLHGLQIRDIKEGCEEIPQFVLRGEKQHGGDDASTTIRVI